MQGILKFTLLVLSKWDVFLSFNGFFGCNGVNSPCEISCVGESCVVLFTRWSTLILFSIDFVFHD